MSPRTSFLIAVATVLLVPTLVAAQPATQPYACTAYIDADNNPATGGDVDDTTMGFRIDVLNVAVTNPYTPTPTPPPS
jgi:hypothetical protein